MEGGPVALGSTGPGSTDQGATGPGSPPGPRPIPGTVVFTRSGQQPVQVAAGSSGTFSARLAPGAYQVTARSPRVVTVTASGQQREQPCSQPRSVSVSAGQRAAITLTCIVP
jgi:hypothetical protein